MYQNYNILINISMNQRIAVCHLIGECQLSSLRRQSFHARVNPSFLVYLVGVHVLQTMYCSSRFHDRRIISNIILQLSRSLLSKLNELQSDRLTRVSVIIIQYNDACTKLRLTFPNVCMFCLRHMLSVSPSG